jgi:glycosyltransferase involved in cell wall biosynthesis
LSLLSLLRHLPREQVQPWAVVPPGPLSDRLAALDIPITPIRAHRFHRSGKLRNWLSTFRWLHQTRRQVVSLHRRIGADLIHANSLSACLPVIARGRPLPPVVLHFRDLAGPPLFLRWVVPRCAAVIAISRVVERRVREEAPASADRVRVIYNGIAADDLPPGRGREAVRAELGAGPQTPVVISVGQLVPWKRHDLLLEAARELQTALPEARWWVVGADLFEDNAEYARRLREEAPANVVFTGYRPDAVDLLRAADVCAHAATAEAFGRVLLEAMYVGTPCVAPAAGGIPELLTHDVTGWLVPPAEAPALARGVQRLLADAPLRERLAAAAQESARSEFSAQGTAAATVALYRELRGRRDACA